jgi:hypothetical protein
VTVPTQKLGEPTALEISKLANVFKNQRPNVPYEVLRQEARIQLQASRGAGVAGTSWKDGHGSYDGIDNPIVRIRFNDRVDADGKRVLFIEEFQPPTSSSGNWQKMPKTLQDRWLAIGVKRMIRHAADNGYDKVAWTTGEQQVNGTRMPAEKG